MGLLYDWMEEAEDKLLGGSNVEQQPKQPKGTEPYWNWLKRRILQERRLRTVRIWVTDLFWIVLGIGGMIGVGIAVTMLWRLYTIVADVQVVVK